MASETVLKELFKVAKISSAFKGVSDEEVWKACQAYSERTDEDIHIAISNIRKKDAELKNKSEEEKERLEKGKKKVIALHKKEEVDRRVDNENAEKILESLFNS